jgi:hypothetical protein
VRTLIFSMHVLVFFSSYENAWSKFQKRRISGKCVHLLHGRFKQNFLSPRRERMNEEQSDNSTES